jgi:hypothetical protein
MTQPPPVPDEPQADEGTDLRFVASKQKGIITCILLYLLVVLVRFVMPPRLDAILLATGGVIAIVAAVFVFQLSVRLHGKGLGILFGILTLVPLVGLVVLLVVNGKATALLKENGWQVGFLGAKEPPR